MESIFQGHSRRFFLKRPNKRNIGSQTIPLVIQSDFYEHITSPLIFTGHVHLRTGISYHIYILLSIFHIQKNGLLKPFFLSVRGLRDVITNNFCPKILMGLLGMGARFEVMRERIERVMA
ncbi:MAG: hypothetical protein WAU31_03445 [Candidatus Moraniibacteriota bacterium]